MLHKFGANFRQTGSGITMRFYDVQACPGRRCIFPVKWCSEGGWFSWCVLISNVECRTSNVVPNLTDVFQLWYDGRLTESEVKFHIDLVSHLSYNSVETLVIYVVDEAFLKQACSWSRSIIELFISVHVWAIGLLHDIGPPLCMSEVDSVLCRCWWSHAVFLVNVDDLALRLRVWITPSLRIDNGRAIC